MWKIIFPFICILLFISFYATDSSAQERDIQAITTEKQYFDSLFASTEVQFQQEFEFPFVLILGDSQKQIYDGIDSLLARKSFIQSYWQRENPNPILPENKILTYFLDRWNYVKTHFSSSSPPFFDDRGKYYVRYGKPTNWYKDSGGRKTVRFFQDRSVYNYIGNIYSGIPPATYYNVHPNESWVYRDISLDFVIHFVKEGAQFHEVESLMRAIDSRISKNVAWYWNDMIQPRAHLSPAIARAANNMMQIENDILASTFIGSVGPLRKDSRLPHQQILEQKSLLESDLIHSKSDVPLYLFYEGPIKSKLDFYSDITQFRGTNDSTRIEIVVLTPVQNNIFDEKVDFKLDTIGIELQSLFRDSTFQVQLNTDDKLKYPIDFFNQSKFDNLINYQTILLPAQNGDLTLQIKELAREKSGHKKQPLSIRNFNGRHLMISDIQFFAEINEEEFLKFLPTFKIGNIRVRPYPYETIHNSLPAFCYFEIYNIQTSGIDKEFEIELKVLSKKERKGIIKSIIQWIAGSNDIIISIFHSRPVTEDTSNEFIAVDFSNLSEGNYVLEITILDITNKDHKVTAHKTITISE